MRTQRCKHKRSQHTQCSKCRNIVGQHVQPTKHSSKRACSHIYGVSCGVHLFKRARCCLGCLILGGSHRHNENGGNPVYCPRDLIVAHSSGGFLTNPSCCGPPDVYSAPRAKSQANRVVLCHLEMKAFIERSADQQVLPTLASFRKHASLVGHLLNETTAQRFEVAAGRANEGTCSEILSVGVDPPGVAACSFRGDRNKRLPSVFTNKCSRSTPHRHATSTVWNFCVE